MMTQPTQGRRLKGMRGNNGTFGREAEKWLPFQEAGS